MDRTTYADPEVRTLVRRRFTAIRVDADRRPDVAERYTLGGWPTTACLTAGGEILAGGVLLEPSSLHAMLVDVDEAYRTRPGEIAGRALDAARRRSVRPPITPSSPEPAGEASRWFESFSTEAFDARHGGFGERPKWPHAGVLRLLLRRYRETADTHLRDRIAVSLDAMADRGLLDPVEGGFFRYAESADWSSVHSEKLLEVNADGLGLYVDAWRTLGRSRDLETVEAVLRFLLATLWNAPERLFSSSQRADAEYYRLGSTAARRSAASPPVDRTVYVGSNARMVSALLELAGATGDATVGERALSVLEQLLVRAYRPGEGVAHVVDAEPSVFGQLGDQIWSCHATLDAFEASGDAAYLDLSQELMLYGLRTMWDDAEGGFFDRAQVDGDGDVGLLRDPMKPLDLNGEAARVLVRLARVTEREEFSTRAAATIASCRDGYRSHGLGAAAYVRAVVEATESDAASRER